LDFNKLYKILFSSENGTYRAVCANDRVEKETLNELKQIRKCNYNEGIKILKKALQELKGDKENKVIPEIYRKAMFFLTCKLCDEAGTKGAQKKVLDDLNLSHNTFSKYRMTPVQYYDGIEFNMGKSPKLPINRNGKKNETLCKTFIEISSQVHYTDFVDVFAGLGTITAMKPMISKEYLNDYDEVIYKFLLTIRDFPELLVKWENKIFEDICSKKDENKRIEYAKFKYKELSEKLSRKNGFHKISKILKDSFEIFNIVKTWHKDYYDLDGEKLKSILELYERFTEEDIKESFFVYLCNNMNSITIDKSNLDTLESYYNEFVKAIVNTYTRESNVKYAKGFYKEKFKLDIQFSDKSFYDTRIRENERVAESSFEEMIEIAGAFYFYSFFNARGTYKEYGVNIDSLKEFKDSLEDIKKYSNRIKNIKIFNQDFRDIIKSFNTKDTLLYLDSPYLDTEGYEIDFDDQDFTDLINSLNNFRGKWIFSCRASFKKYDKELEEKGKSNEQKIERLAKLFSGFRKRGYYIIEIGGQGYRKKDIEVMITNFKFIHEQVENFDDAFERYSNYDIY